jgi:hypothetical protein
MAKSLLCKDCNTLLRDIKEAQSHNEVTGHANFEETTEVVRLMPVCRGIALQALRSMGRQIETFPHVRYRSKSWPARSVASPAARRQSKTCTRSTQATAPSLTR